MTVLALSNKNIQTLTNWVGGTLVILVIAALVLLDMKVLTSSRSKLGLVLGTIVVGLLASVVVVFRFVRLSV